MRRLPPYIVELCRQLRKGSTSAEELLWRCLRRKQLSGFKFRRQHPIHRYIVDLCCPDAKLIIELDGAIHDDREQAVYDHDREEYLTMLGYRVLRFQNAEVIDRTEAVLRKILDTLTPTPLP
jgi:very-short-patch-repair endonuclease